MSQGAGVKTVAKCFSLEGRRRLVLSKPDWRGDGIETCDQENEVQDGRGCDRGLKSECFTPDNGMCSSNWKRFITREDDVLVQGTCSTV